MHANPTVSVIIPAYNAESTLRRAVESVRGQNWPGIEIVVVDDASTDSTAAIAASLAGPDLILVRQTENGGAARARNAGIRASAGRYVAFLDADDVWLPGKVAAQVARLEANPRAGLVACGADFIALDGTNRGEIGKYKGPPVTGAQAWRALLAYTFLSTPAVMVLRDVLDRVGLFDENLPTAEDQDLWIRVALASEVEYVPRQLVYVFERPGSLSRRSHFDGVRHTLPMIRRHVAANAGRLTRQEVRAILGMRHAVEGRHLCYEGHWRLGAALLLRASGWGHEPLANAVFLLRSAPPLRRLKHVLGTRLAARRAMP